MLEDNAKQKRENKIITSSDRQLVENQKEHDE